MMHCAGSIVLWGQSKFFCTIRLSLNDFWWYLMPVPLACVRVRGLRRTRSWTALPEPVVTDPLQKVEQQTDMKHIGFLTFGHYQHGRGSAVPTARDALLQTIKLAVAAEEN